VSIIRSKVINFTSDLSRIFSDPSRRYDAAENVTNYVTSNGQDRFVLKPSTAALARGLIFIDRDNEQQVIRVTIPKAGEDNKDIITEYDASNIDDLNSYLQQYFLEERTHDQTFLLQDFVENLETSAVYIDEMRILALMC